MDQAKKDPIISKTEKSKVTRRNFVRGAATIAAVAATLHRKPYLGGPGSIVEASTIPYESDKRSNQSFRYRRRVAQDNHIDIGEVPDNGDRARYSDFSGNFSKVLRHDGLGVPNHASYQSFLDALENATFADLQGVIVGTPGGGPN